MTVEAKEVWPQSAGGAVAAEARAALGVGAVEYLAGVADLVAEDA